MSSDNLVMMSARVPENLKRLVDMDERTNQEVLQDALWREIGSEERGRIKRRIEEKENRVEQAKKEKNERERELQREREELEAWRDKLENVKSEEKSQRKRALQKLSGVQLRPDTPLIVNEAERLGMEPEELAKEAAKFHDKDYKDENGDSDLRSI